MTNLQKLYYRAQDEVWEECKRSLITITDDAQLLEAIKKVATNLSDISSKHMLMLCEENNWLLETNLQIHAGTKTYAVGLSAHLVLQHVVEQWLEKELREFYSV